MWKSFVSVFCCFPLCLPDSFWTNPQYRVKIDEMLSECSAKQGEKNILVSLMQKPDKRNRRLVKNLHIGFMVYEVNEIIVRQCNVCYGYVSLCS